MKSPFPYFGAKGDMAPEIWHRFGDPAYYFEPFAGSLGALLGRPKVGKYEFVGDTDCHITNLYRAVQYADHRELARLAKWPVSQLDLQARTKWLKEQRQRLHLNLIHDPKWYDIECAAWYAWTQSVRISTNGTTIVLGRTTGVLRKRQNLEEYFASLANRLKDVVFDFGDWTRIATAALRNSKRADCAILLDPPYDLNTGRQKNLYAQDSPDVSPYVRRWALARAKTHPRLRIALCGYGGEHKMPGDWEELPWWSRMGKGKERIWFSPNCLKVSEAKSA